MKQLIISLIFGAILFTGCQPNSNTPTTQASSAVSSNTGGKKEAKVVAASVLAPIVGTWQVQQTAGIAKIERRKPYVDRWFSLRGDQTFSVGVNGQESNQGVYEYNGSSFLLDLFFDTPEPGIAIQYKLLGVGGSDPSILIWQGNTPNNPAGMQLKMVKIDDPNLQ